MSRQTGPLFTTKRYHNYVKQILYGMFTKQGDSIVDIGCGKGGDLHKWEVNRLRSVMAVDINAAYIEEAKRRQSEKKKMQTHVTFLETDAFADISHVNDGHLFDAMSCMFCLHYAARDEASIHRAFQNASSLLKPGGVFFGVCADGDVIVHSGDIDNDIVRVTIQPKPAGQWGRAYQFELCDSIVSENNVEFVTQPNDLIQVASQFGLSPVTFNDCAQWRTKIAHAFPNLVGTDEQTPDERLVSSMYFVYAFVKS